MTEERRERRERVKRYMATYGVGLLEARHAIAIEDIKHDIDQFQWNGSRDALARALKSLVDLVT